MPGTTPAQTTRWITTSAGEVHVQDLGEGPTLLFVHGALVDEALWSHIAPPLAARGFRCVAPTLPLGSHTRPMRPDADLSPQGITRILADIVRELGAGPVVVVGNDSGGGFSQIFAAAHPELVSALVLTSCDAYEQFPPPMMKPLFKLLTLPGAMAVGGFLLRAKALRKIAFPKSISHHATDDLVRRWTTPMRDAAIRGDSRKVFAGFDSRHTLGAIAKLRSWPGHALVIWGADDRVFPTSLARRLVADLPNARLEAVPDASAFVPIDAPDRVVELVAEFGQQLADSRA